MLSLLGMSEQTGLQHIQQRLWETDWMTQEAFSNKPTLMKLILWTKEQNQWYSAAMSINYLNKLKLNTALASHFLF